MNEIIYGVHTTDGKIISIDEVPDNMFGLACNCTCALCGIKLQACSLNGKVSRYFRHHRQNRYGDFANCNPNIANETALHQMVKQIIQEEKKFMIPDQIVLPFEVGIYDLPEKIEVYNLKNSKMMYAESVELESCLNTFTADVRLKTTNEELLIEVFVTHAVDEDKKKKVREYGVSMLEIDLREYIDIPITSEYLKKMIIESEKNKKWVYFPLSSDDVDKIKLYYENEHKRVIEEEKKRLEEAKVKDLALEEEQKQIYEEYKKNLKTNKQHNDPLTPEQEKEAYRYVSKYNFSKPYVRYDKFDRIWVKCKYCNQIKLASEMERYNYGIGECKKCCHNQENVSKDK